MTFDTEDRPPARPPGVRPPSREDIWDTFVDELDHAGQAGSAAHVLTPADLHPEAPAAKRFGDLTRVEIDNLAKIGSTIGRRGDVVKDMWDRVQQQLKSEKRAKK
jgi:hypothetical protein